MNDELDKIKELASMVAKRMGYEIFDIKSHKRGRKRIVTITIDNMKDYVSIKDCESFSRELSPLLDAEVMLGNYILEVSSPGLDRPLRNLKDFKRFEGRLAKVTVQEQEGKSLTVIGKINNCDEENGTFSLEVDGKMKTYEFSKVKSANLEIEF
ncbi:ribosome maturation factor RimP [Mesoaciditoga lauensis]|uniref:ribosome maturation factor RimP n=1 Tax=Mesoaciditoga lauensis TaxID=1495039 RepID=UPI0005660AAA|nr:ribosome maturation factor RimP [Mesoaciditoga lauensis]